MKRTLTGIFKDPGRLAAWLFRASWVSLVVAVAPAIGGALADNSRPVQLVGTTIAWLIWAVGLVASLVPACVSLTVLRLVAGVPLAASVGAAVAGASTDQFVAAIGVSCLAVVIGLGAELGGVFVQGSAYGDERRVALRPPGPLLLGPIPLLWALLAGSALTGPLLLAGRSWIAGSIVTLIGTALAVVLGPRFHRLSLRWLVFVPAGLVVHDQVVLAETVMFRVNEVAGIRLAPSDTEAADLTGAALGNALEVRLGATGTVVLAATSEHPGGRALHVKSFLVSPSRPGRAIAEARQRNIPA